MKTINSLTEIVNWAEKAIAQDTKLYIRWSRGPKFDQKMKYSQDQNTKQYHNGLSCQNVRHDSLELLTMMIPEYEFVKNRDNKIYCWIFCAEQNGLDSDDAPTVDADTIVPIGRLSDDLIDKCREFNRIYWLLKRTDFKTWVKGLNLSDFGL